MAEINCDELTTREINTRIRQLIADGETEILIQNPGARHNLGVAIVNPANLVFDDSVGYYCAGMIDGPTVEINGSAGWGLAESMMTGTVIVRGSAGNGAGASIRGGTVVIHGHAAARLGVSMKGGNIFVAGNCGYMAGFMAQKGIMIVCGDVGEAFADSMYGTTCFVGGEIGELGSDAMVKKPTKKDLEFLESNLDQHFPDQFPDPKAKAKEFKKIVAEGKLWRFDKKERALWREAL